MEKIIGVVGGVGPYAGLDLNKKIFDNTTASTDQEHLEVYLLSRSNKINDRTDYLENQKIQNPALEIYKTIEKLNSIGASIIGIPCNTAHSPLIFDEVKRLIGQNQLNLILVNMIEETIKFIKDKFKKIKKIGLLATNGTYKSLVYDQAFKKDGVYKLLIPDKIDRELVHSSIYNKDYGIKSFSNPIKNQVLENFSYIIKKLEKNGSEAIIMGCTEIPLALKQSNFKIPLIDPTNILARSLIKECNISKLK